MTPEQRQRARDVIRGELSVDTRDLLLRLVQQRQRSLQSDVAYYLRDDDCTHYIREAQADLAKVNTALDELCEYGSAALAKAGASHE